MSGGGQGSGGMGGGGFQGYGGNPYFGRTGGYQPKPVGMANPFLGQGGLQTYENPPPPPTQAPWVSPGTDEFSDPMANPTYGGPQSMSGAKPMYLGGAQPMGLQTPSNMNSFSNSIAGFRVPGATQAPGANMGLLGGKVGAGTGIPPGPGTGTPPNVGQTPTFPGDPRYPGYQPGQGNQIMQEQYAAERARQMAMPAPFGRYPDGTPRNDPNQNFRADLRRPIYGGGWGT